MMIQEAWRRRSLESVLGRADGRFFGHGYRGVRHALSVSPDEARDQWVATVSYPPSWSRDADGRRRRPHLSTVDAVVLPLMALGLSAERSGSAAKLDHAYVSRIDLRAGTVPWLELDSVPVSLCTRQSADATPGQGEECFDAVTGNMRASLAITSPRPADRCSGSRAPADPPCSLGVYGGLYKDTHVESILTDYEGEPGRLTAVHRFSAEEEAPEACDHGIEGAYWPALSVVDYLVTMGQMAQALIQLRHGDARSGTLWMRRMTICLERPPESLPVQIDSTMTMHRDRLIDRLGHRYRDIVVTAQTSSRVRVDAYLAHEEAP